MAKLNKTVHSVYTASDSVDWQTGFHDANANGGPHSGTPILFFYHCLMKTWPGGLPVGKLGDLLAMFSSENGRGEFICFLFVFWH